MAERVSRFAEVERDPWLGEVQSRDDFTYGRVGPDRFLVGSPDEVVAAIRIWPETVGVDYLIVRLRHPGGPAHQRVIQVIEQFGRDVIPALRDGNA